VDKRYQVFVSSTFIDLKEERSSVIQTLMKMDCIPAGMELFPALDEEQFEFIKKIIDDCDYYLLIIGGRYGSLTSEGISYTEKEYDYAVSKGIKVLALIHGAPEQIPLGKSEETATARRKLEAFREKVKQGRLVEFWTKSEELPGKVAIGMNATIKTYPATGWVRASHLDRTNQLLSELNEVRKLNDQLRVDLEQLRSQATGSQVLDHSVMKETITVKGSYTQPGPTNQHPQNPPRTPWQREFSWEDIFRIIGPYLLTNPTEDHVRSSLAHFLFRSTGIAASQVGLEDGNLVDVIKLQLMAFGLIDARKEATATQLTWYLTEQGKRMMLILNARRIR